PPPGPHPLPRRSRRGRRRAEAARGTAGGALRSPGDAAQGGEQLPRGHGRAVRARTHRDPRWWSRRRARGRAGPHPRARGAGVRKALVFQALGLVLGVACGGGKPRPDYGIAEESDDPNAGGRMLAGEERAARRPVAAPVSRDALTRRSLDATLAE